MSLGQHRLVLVGGALAWLFLGLHLPIVHQFTHHGRTPQIGLVALLALFAVLSIGALVLLWPRRPHDESGSSTTRAG
jgi:hypothetical protein